MAAVNPTSGKPVRHVTLPMSEQTARSLTAGEMILVDGQVTITAGIPTLDRILSHLDQGTALPIDLTGAAIFHVGSYSREVDGELDVLYMNPTTSTRFNPHMPRLIRELKLHAVGGKGGLSSPSREAMSEVGCVYLSLLGGGSVLLTESIKEVLSVHWDDFVPHYRLVTLRVEALGPLTVAIDAHGNSIYEQLTDTARANSAQIFSEMAREREAAAAGEQP